MFTGATLLPSYVTFNLGWKHSNKILEVQLPLLMLCQATLSPFRENEDQDAHRALGGYPT